MSNLVGVVGGTGTGKTTALRTLPPEETFIINVVGKPLPFKGWKAKFPAVEKKDGKLVGRYYSTDDSEKICTALRTISEEMPKIKHIIIDDSQYLMSNEFMKRAKEKTYDKFTDIGKHMWDVLNTARTLRENLKVFILTHDELMKEGDIRKMKTIGKLLDDKITLEGLFTVVLFTYVTKDTDTNKIRYQFITQTDGSTTAKSPEGMFDTLLIDNDLKFVADAIDKYENEE